MSIAGSPPDLTFDITRIENQYSAAGSLCDVYRCLYHGGAEEKEVAVKALRFKLQGESSGRRYTEIFRRELGIWRRLKHDNIVPFLGIAYGFGMDGSVSLVSLWMSNGSLQNFLAIHDNDLSLQHRLKLLLDISNGLNYLHSLPIVHGDLNCNNVLLDADYTARLADFGLASLIGDIPEMLAYLRGSTIRPGTLRYAAPEQIGLGGTSTRTIKSDIYSFGCVLSGDQPWSEVREDAGVILALAVGHKPRRPESRIMDNSHWNLIQNCWSPIGERPATDVIIITIQRFLRDCPTSQPLRDSLVSRSSQTNLASEQQSEMSTLGIQFQLPPDLTPYIVRTRDQYAAGGSFGDVYKCLYRGDSEQKEVAVKAIRFSYAIECDSGNKSTNMMIRRELGIWRRLNHDNIVPFLGIAYGFGLSGSISLVSLWMPNDSLHRFIAMHENSLEVQHRLQLLLDVANGLNYLHSLQIVHGDLNSNNVLLDADYTARLVDFGYSSLEGNIPNALDYLQRSTGRPGALRWIAPEQVDLEETFTRTIKSDIYSFGCVLSGKEPWSEVREDAAVVIRLARGRNPGRPMSPKIEDSHWRLIQDCWSPVEERPVVEVMIFTIQRFLEDFPRSRSLRDTFSPWSKSTDLVSNEDDHARISDLQKRVEQSECRGDEAVQSNNLDGAVLRYSITLSLNPSDTVGVLVKRSKALALLGRWKHAMWDADEAIRIDPRNPWGYERRHAALHGLQHYDEAIDAFTRMFFLIEESLDPDIRRLTNNYISPARSEMIVDDAVREVFKMSPLIHIDVKSGCLCNGQERMRTFKSEQQFKELISSMTQQVDSSRIQHVVEKYFLYVTLSHVWQGNEPSFQDVHLAGSVWQLDSSPLNEKLRKFCEVVRADGYRWAWSDTCCIDKTIGTVLNQSLTMMYKWYEASAATYIFLVDVPSLSSLGELLWMTRAWTAQELLAAKVIRFYDRNWQPYHGDTRANHKESPKIMQELMDAIGVTGETIINFNPDSLSVREKLRLASTRSATVEEDVAYSLIGIFKSDIRPHYGEGYAALGHLLEEIIARSGDVTVLNWTGTSSPYNSCLPATLAVYSQPPHTSPAIEDAETDVRVAALRALFPEEETTLFHAQVTCLAPARFAHRRLHLPSIIFAVQKLRFQGFGSGHEYYYRARVSGIGSVEFHTSDRLSPEEPRRLIFVHPWIRDLREPPDWFTSGSREEEEESGSESGDKFTTPPSSPNEVPAVPTDAYTRVLRLVVRLRQPFHALLLQQQASGEFKRVAAEHAIVVPGIDLSINFCEDVRTEIVEIL